MISVLILYPPEFSSQTKFDRKVENIISRLTEFRVIFARDDHHLIKGFFSSKSKLATLVETVAWEEQHVTHAIVFCDSEAFIDEIAKLEQLGIPLRKIKIKITRVTNIKKDERFAGLKSTPSYEYIGRGSYWGNPYSMFAEGDSREEVIRKYKYDFDNEKFPKKEKSEVYKLVGKTLGCFCKPESCHGDILADFLNGWDDGN